MGLYNPTAIVSRGGPKAKPKKSPKSKKKSITTKNLADMRNNKSGPKSQGGNSTFDGPEGTQRRTQTINSDAAGDNQKNSKKYPNQRGS
jgi:hypothetical protein